MSQKKPATPCVCPCAARPLAQARTARRPAARWLAPALGAVIAWATTPAQAAGAHQHGTARVDIAVEPAALTVFLEIPLDDLVGFERAPRTEAERTRVAEALARLREPGALVRPDPRGGCEAGFPEIVSPTLGLTGKPVAPEAAAAGHANLQATWVFECRPSARPEWVDLRLFDAFPRLRRVEVQSATPQGQRKTSLSRPAGRVMLNPPRP